MHKVLVIQRAQWIGQRQQNLIGEEGPILRATAPTGAGPTANEPGRTDAGGLRKHIPRVKVLDATPLFALSHRQPDVAEAFDLRCRHCRLQDDPD